MTNRFYVGALACLALWACTDDKDDNNDDSGMGDDTGTVRDDTGVNDDTGKNDDTSGGDDSGEEEHFSARLELVVDGLTAPVDLATLPWDKGHLYIVDQPGLVYRIDPSAGKVELGKPW